jgi:hypothetical protein
MSAVRICPDCKYVPPEAVDDGAPGVAIRFPVDESHRSDCPRVSLSREAQERLDEQFRGFQRMRDRGWAEAQTAWVG